MKLFVPILIVVAWRGGIVEGNSVATKEKKSVDSWISLPINNHVSLFDNDDGNNDQSTMQATNNAKGLNTETTTTTTTAVDPLIDDEEKGIEEGPLFISGLGAPNNNHFHPLQQPQQDDSTPIMRNEEEEKQEFTAAADSSPNSSFFSQLLKRALLKRLAPNLRHLALGDFEDFNNLFQGAVLALPNTTITERILGSTLTLEILNLRCMDISVGDVTLDYNLQSNQELTMDLQVLQLDLTCFLDYTYRYVFFRGRGSAQAYTDENGAQVQLSIWSEGGFSGGKSPPQQIRVTGCDSTVNISDLDFSGGFVASILDTFERLMRSTVAGQVRAVICDELQALGDDFGTDALAMLSDYLNPYLVDTLPANVSDPLSPEQQLMATNNNNDSSIINFGDLDGLVGSWVNSALTEADKFLGELRDDDVNGTALTGMEQDLGVNILLRQYLLDPQDRSFTVNVSSLDFLDGGVLFDGHDKLTQTTIRVDQVKIFGLDTFQKFDSLQFIGNYTISNDLSWDYLTVEIDLTIDIRPSTLPDSIIATPGAEHVVEKTQIRVGVDKIDATVAILLAVSLDKLGELSLGSLLELDNLLPCLLSSIVDVQLAGMQVSVESIRDPVLDGFVSRGIDRLVTGAVEALFVMYESTIVRALPNLFQMELRRILNQDVITPYLEKPGNADCPGPALGFLRQNTAIDFRDLFLPSSESIMSGGQGTEPYGDLGFTLRSLVDDLLFSVDDDTGLPSINRVLLRPVTKSQSGIEGTIKVDELFDFTKTTFSTKVQYFVNFFRVAAYNLRLEHLDTLISPLRILQPINVAHTLANLVAFGTVNDDEYLTLKIRALLELEGGSPLDMKNEFDLIVSSPDSVLSANLFAKLDATDLGNFALKDIGNENCWFSKVMIDEGIPQLAIRDFFLAIANLKIDAECIECRSRGVALLPGLVKLMQQTGGIRTLGKRIELLADELVEGGYVQSLLDRFVLDSATKCPHDPLYIPGSSNDTSLFSDIGFPPLSKQMIETALYTVVMAAQVGFIIFAENHNQRPLVRTWPLSLQEELDNNSTTTPDERRLVDFMALNETVGSFLATGISAVQSYLSEEIDLSDSPPANEDVGDAFAEIVRNAESTTTTAITDLGINVFIRDYLFNSANNTKFGIEFDGTNFRVGNLKVDVIALNFLGLDTITSIEVVEPIGPQTILNSLHWKEISLELDLGITLFESNDEDAAISEGPEVLTISIGVKDLDMKVALFAAMDIDKLGGIELGSLLTSDRIFACFMSMIDRIEMTQMASTIGQFGVSNVKGFLSDDLRDNLLELVETAFTKYQPELVAGFPLVVDQTLRPLLNGALVAYTERPNVQCLSNEGFQEESIVDFRDLFLSEREAIEAGTNGGAPYGDVASFVKTFIEAELLQVDAKTGEPPLNDFIIRPFTKDQSGVEGELFFPGSILGFDIDSIEKFGIDLLTIQVSDAQVTNLDTLGQPLVLLEPNNTNGMLLDNAARVGAGEKQVTGQVQLLVQITGDPRLSMYNELDIGINFEEASIFSTVLTRMRERGIMKFPLRDALNLRCWLGALAPMELDENGIALPGSNSSLSFESLVAAVEELGFHVECSNCTSPGLTSISNLTDILQTTGVTDEVEDRLVDFAIELVQSDFMQILLDRVVHDSSRQCRHSQAYVENYTAPDYDGPKFPSLSRESIETVVFTGVVAIEVAAVLIAQSHANETDASSINPLEAQEDIHLIFQEFPGVRLIDFTKLDEIVGSWADSAISEANKYLGGNVDDVGGPNGDTDLGINVVVRSLLLDDDGAVSVKLDSVSLSENGMEISLDEIQIYGLDSFTTFSAFDPIGRQTLQNKFALEKLSIEVDITIVAGDFPTSSILRRLSDEGEQLSLSFGMQDVNASMSAFLAVDRNKLDLLTLGSLLNIDQILPCFLSTAPKVEMTELNVNVGQLDSLEVKGFLSPRLLDILSNTTAAIMEDYNDMIIDAIPTLFDQTMRTLANNWISYYLNLESSTACPAFSFEKFGNDTIVDLRDLLFSEEIAQSFGGTGDSRYGNLFRRILEFVNNRVLVIDEVDGTSAVNEFIIAPLTETQSQIPGTLFYGKNLLDTGSQRIDVGGFQAWIELKAFNARVENLDTVGAPLSILDPVLGMPHNLNNTASFGVGERPLRFGVTVLISLRDDGDLQLRNEVDLSIDIKSATVVLDALLKIQELPFTSFPLKDIQNLDCWLATIPTPVLDPRGVRLEGYDPTAGLETLIITLAQLGINVNCISCSSPRMQEFADLVTTAAAKNESTRVGRTLLDYGSQLLEGEFLQLQIDRRLGEAPQRCPHSAAFRPNASPIEYAAFVTPEQKDDTVAFLITLAIVAASLIFALIALMLAIKFIVARRNRAWVKKLPKDTLQALYDLQASERARATAMNRLSTSMFTSPHVPTYLRFLMPVLILGNVGLFLSGHFNLGGAVNVQAQLAGEQVTIDKFFEFSIAQSTLDMWRAGAKELAILILIFSGVWPYTKQFCTLFLWFAPPRVVSIARRGSILLWLDALAKWSMIDVFVLVTSIVAFRISIQSPDVDFLPDNFYSVDLLVQPLWGLYANAIAQVISQISAHFIIHFHRRIEEVAARDYERERQGNDEVDKLEMGPGGDVSFVNNNTNNDENNANLEEKKVLKDHTFARPHRGESDKLHVRSGVNSGLCFMSLVILCFVTVGCSLPSFSVELLGMLGIFVESGQEFEQARANHSVFTIIQLLFEQANFLGSAADYVGLGGLSILFLLSVLIVPVLQGAALIYQWFVPMNSKMRNRMNVLIETLQAWQYVEVYLIAVIVSAWQLGPISKFMINSFCGDLENTFATLVYYGILDPQDGQCFQVQAGVEHGTFLLVVGAVALALLNTFVQKAVRQFERDQARIMELLDTTRFEEDTLGPDDDDNEGNMRRTIEPSPVLFSDTFRWFLRREDAVISQEALMGLDEQAMLGVKKDFVTSAKDNMVTVLPQDDDDASKKESKEMDESNHTPMETKEDLAFSNTDHMVDVDLKIDDNVLSQSTIQTSTYDSIDMAESSIATPTRSSSSLSIGNNKTAGSESSTSHSQSPRKSPPPPPQETFTESEIALSPKQSMTEEDTQPKAPNPPFTVHLV